MMMDLETIRQIDIYRTQLPLKETYLMSLGSVVSFETIFVRMLIDAGEGWGEATCLEGYHWGTARENYLKITEMAGRIAGRTCRDTAAMLESWVEPAHIETGPLMGAMESAVASNTDAAPLSFSLPIVKHISLCDGFAEKVRLAAEEGFTVIKSKIGIDPTREESLLRQAGDQLKNVPFELRLDANQSLSWPAAERFSRILMDLPAAPYLEQPFRAFDWNSVEKWSRSAAVPIMLDESIYTLDDIDRAHELGVKWIKLKLLKTGSAERLLCMIRRAKVHGMRVVLGNGVATHWQCALEAKVWHQAELASAGEMNGFERMMTSIGDHALSVRKGRLQVSLKPKNTIDLGPIEPYILEQRSIKPS